MFCDGSRRGIPAFRAKDVDFWYTAFIFKAGLMYVPKTKKSYRNFLRVLKRIIIRSRVFENWP